MTQIDTPRLTLLAFSLAQLETYTSSLPDLSKELGFPLLGDPNQPAVARAIRLKMEIMRPLSESNRLWVTYWLIILRQERIGAGLLGFKGQPDALGQVEIGYGINEAHQNKGYMTEAVRALSHWALQQPGCNLITAEIYNGNAASIRVQQKLGASLSSRDEEKSIYQLKRAQRTSSAA